MEERDAYKSSILFKDTPLHVVNTLRHALISGLLVPCIWLVEYKSYSGELWLETVTHMLGTVPVRRIKGRVPKYAQYVSTATPPTSVAFELKKTGKSNLPTHVYSKDLKPIGAYEIVHYKNAAQEKLVEDVFKEEGFGTAPMGMRLFGLLKDEEVDAVLYVMEDYGWKHTQCICMHAYIEECEEMRNSHILHVTSTGVKTVSDGLVEASAFVIKLMEEVKAIVDVHMSTFTSTPIGSV